MTPTTPANPATPTLSPADTIHTPDSVVARHATTATLLLMAKNLRTIACTPVIWDRTQSAAAAARNALRDHANTLECVLLWLADPGLSPLEQEFLDAMRRVLTTGGKIDMSFEENRHQFDLAIADGWAAIRHAEEKERGA